MSIEDIKKSLRENMIVGPLYHKLAVAYGWIRMRKTHSAFLKYGDENFSCVVRALNDAGIRFFPAFGTLLGLVRDGQLIPHDLDLDFGVIVDGKEYDWDRLIPALEKAGFSVLHWFESEGIVLEMTFVSPASIRVHIDFFAFFRRDDRLVTHTCWKAAGREYKEKNCFTLYEETFPYFDQLVFKDYLGVTVPMPACAEDLLEASYTSSWRIPNPQWKEEYKPNKKEVEGVFARIHVNK